MNVATPIPVGASYLALNEDQATKFKSQEELDLEASAPLDKYEF